ncbi:MAG: AAA family ATPase, partial [Planctomycetes bacterium]|nr:AAA family ATPase [Planctomycetota bacterium]
KIVEFVGNGDFGLASGRKSDGTFERVWFEELMGTDEVAFESGVFLLLKDKAKELVALPVPGPGPTDPPEPGPAPVPGPGPTPGGGDEPRPPAARQTLRVHGEVPPELWNRLGTKLLPKLKSGSDVKVEIDLVVTADGAAAEALKADLRQILTDLGINDKVTVACE